MDLKLKVFSAMFYLMLFVVLMMSGCVEEGASERSGKHKTSAPKNSAPSHDPYIVITSAVFDTATSVENVQLCIRELDQEKYIEMEKTAIMSQLVIKSYCDRDSYDRAQTFTSNYSEILYNSDIFNAAMLCTNAEEGLDRIRVPSVEQLKSVHVCEYVKLNTRLFENQPELDITNEQKTARSETLSEAMERYETKAKMTAALTVSGEYAGKANKYYKKNKRWPEFLEEIGGLEKVNSPYVKAARLVNNGVLVVTLDGLDSIRGKNILFKPVYDKANRFAPPLCYSRDFTDEMMPC